MDREDVVHTYSGIFLCYKWNEILPFAATWMDIESVKQSEVSQKEKGKYCIIKFLCEV